jgi:AcrR family transcriptional regulator
MDTSAVNHADAQRAPRRKRSDAQRNLEALLDAAKAVFAASGVDAPAREITDLAGVGVGTLYRHFPKRSDLVVAVLKHEIDDCAELGSALGASDDPVLAITTWIHRYTELVGTKRGLATALHSSGPGFDSLADYVMRRLEPVVASLLQTAADAREVRSDVAATELLYAVALLCQPIASEDLSFNQRMVAIYVDGLRTTREIV